VIWKRRKLHFQIPGNEMFFWKHIILKAKQWFFQTLNYVFKNHFFKLHILKLLFLNHTFSYCKPKRTLNTLWSNYVSSRCSLETSYHRLEKERDEVWKLEVHHEGLQSGVTIPDVMSRWPAGPKECFEVFFFILLKYIWITLKLGIWWELYCLKEC